MNIPSKFEAYIPNISGIYQEQFAILLFAHFGQEMNFQIFLNEIEKLYQQFSEDHSQRLFSRYSKLRGTPKFSKVIFNDNDTDIRNFLLKRIVTLYLIFVQEFDADKVREIMMDRSSDSENYKLTYFDHSLKIHFPVSCDFSEFVHKVRTYLINPIHGLSTKDLKTVRTLTDTFSKLEIQIIQEFSPVMV